MKRELQAVMKELNAISKRVDKLVAALQKAEQPKTQKAVKKATPKAAKKAAPKAVKKVAPKAAKKQVATKVAPKKAAAKVTAADTVLKIIQSLKIGTDTASLMKKTGFNQKKVANLVFKLKKQGKITSPKIGLYVKA